MSERRSARRGVKPNRVGGGIIPDELRAPSARDRLRDGWTSAEMQALDEARRKWYAGNGFDYNDWRVRNQVERG